MELFTGRPADTTGRLPREVRTYDYLDSLGIEYWAHRPRRHARDDYGRTATR